MYVLYLYAIDTLATIFARVKQIAVITLQLLVEIHRVLSDHHFSQAILSMSKTRTQLNVYQKPTFFNTFDLDYYVKILFHFHIYFCLLYAHERIC